MRKLILKEFTYIPLRPLFIDFISLTCFLVKKLQTKLSKMN